MQANPKVAGLTTDELEQYIDLRYEANSLQEELDALEVAYSSRVSDEDLNMTEEELNVSEEIGPNGGNLEHCKASLRHSIQKPVVSVLLNVSYSVM